MGSQETEVVVVTGVGGTDDKTNTHKHASHTKGGTVDAVSPLHPPAIRPSPMIYVHTYGLF